MEATGPRLASRCGQRPASSTRLPAAKLTSFWPSCSKARPWHETDENPMNVSSRYSCVSAVPIWDRMQRRLTSPPRVGPAAPHGAGRALATEQRRPCRDVPPHFPGNHVAAGCVGIRNRRDECHWRRPECLYERALGPDRRGSRQECASHRTAGKVSLIIPNRVRCSRHCPFRSRPLLA